MPVATVGTATTLAAGATTNVVLGTLLEFIGVPSVLNLWATADNAPGRDVLVQLLINVGATQIVPIAAGTSVNAAQAPGAGPKLDEDQLGANIALPSGSRVQFNVTNPDVVGVQFRWRATLAS